MCKSKWALTPLGQVVSWLRTTENPLMLLRFQIRLAKEKRSLPRRKMTFLIFGVPESIRTTGPFLRREVLYPAELRGHVLKTDMI